MAQPDGRPDVSAWILGLAGLLSAMLAWQGFRDGDWRAVGVTEIQVLVVAAAAWLGLRRRA